jgi:hypothetical protein
MITRIIAVFILLAAIFTSCKKESVLQETIQQHQISETKMLWVTPTGITIPYEESHRWEEFVAEKLSQTKSDPPKKKYESFRCEINGTQCGLKCIESTYSTCTSAFECMICANCCITE